MCTPPEMTCGFLIQLVFCIKMCLHHQSVTPFLSGAPPLLRKILVQSVQLLHFGLEVRLPHLHNSHKIMKPMQHVILS